MLTNKYNAPQALFEAIKNDPYSKGDADISVTQLIGPPRIKVLWERHESKIETDVVERFWAACGKSMHLLLGNHTSGDRYITEKRMTVEIEGWKLSGQIDLFDLTTLTLYDYKFVGLYAYKVAAQSGKHEYTAQANIYRWLLAKTQQKLAIKLENIYLIRDWMQSQREKAGYPPVPWGHVEIPLWTLEETENYVRRRIQIHQHAAQQEDKDLLLCSPEERWERNGQSTRCLNYCSVRSVCDFAIHQKEMNDNG